MVCIKIIRFFSYNTLIPNDSAEIFAASSVSITFEWQQRDIRDDTVTHQCSNDDYKNKIMCPVKAAASIISTLYKHGIPKDKIPELKINTIIQHGKLFTVPSSLLLEKKCTAVKSLGKEKLGFTYSEVGTHSNRSGVAMGMFLAGTPVYTIMLLG